MPRLKTLWTLSRIRRHLLRWRIQRAESDFHLKHALSKRDIERRAARLADLRIELRKVEPESAAERVRAIEKSAKRALLAGVGHE